MEITEPSLVLVQTPQVGFQEVLGFSLVLTFIEIFSDWLQESGIR